MPIPPRPHEQGGEISSNVADSDCSIILEQVTNGIALRMALFYLVAEGAMLIRIIGARFLDPP